MATNSNLPQEASISGSYSGSTKPYVHVCAYVCAKDVEFSSGSITSIRPYVYVFMGEFMCVCICAFVKLTHTLLGRWMTLRGFFREPFCRFQSVNKGRTHISKCTHLYTHRVSYNIHFVLKVR